MSYFKKDKRAYLLLADGSIYQGYHFGCEGTTIGEIVFTTGMTGYQEVLTDPSYCGQIVMQTYPLIGNYGINHSDMESSKSWVNGYIVREWCEAPSNFREAGTIDAFLKSQGKVGIWDVDTRQLTRKIRRQGTMNGAITTEDVYAHKDELLEIKNKYADPRRTEISAIEGEIDIADLIAVDDMVVTLTHFGYVKRLSKSTYRAQGRGGKGVSAMTTREDDYAENIRIVNSHEPILFFTNKGRVYTLTCYQIPEASRTARGTAIVNLLQLSGGEKVTNMIPMPEMAEGCYLIMATREGLIKKTALSEFQNLRKAGLISIVLNEGDELIGVEMCRDGEELLLGTRKGKAIRFAERHVRSMGRVSHGVKSMNLEAGDEVTDLCVIEEDCHVLSITENGYGKRTEPEAYRETNRGGQGVAAMNLTDKTGLLAAQLMVKDDEDIILITDDGTVIRTAVDTIRVCGRNTQGVRLMRVGDNARIVGVARTEKEEAEEAPAPAEEPEA